MRAKLVLAFVALLFGAPSAFACSCARVSMEQTRNAAHLIVAGEVVNVETVANGRKRATIRVSRVIKGRAGAMVQIHTSPHPAMCGYVFRVGERGEFLAGRHEGLYFTDNCQMFTGRPRSR